jgi:hypothetical protein
MLACFQWPMSLHEERISRRQSRCCQLLSLSLSLSAMRINLWLLSVVTFSRFRSGNSIFLLSGLLLLSCFAGAWDTGEGPRR